MMPRTTIALMANAAIGHAERLPRAPRANDFDGRGPEDALSAEKSAPQCAHRGSPTLTVLPQKGHPTCVPSLKSCGTRSEAGPDTGERDGAVDRAELAAEDGRSRPQNLQTIAASWIFSAQKGHGFMTFSETRRVRHVADTPALSKIFRSVRRWRRSDGRRPDRTRSRDGGAFRGEIDRTGDRSSRPSPHHSDVARRVRSGGYKRAPTGEHSYSMRLRRRGDVSRQGIATDGMQSARVV